MSGGTANFADLGVIGTDPNSLGVLNVSGNAKYSVGGALYIGSNSGQGTVNLSGTASMTSVGDLNLGNAANAGVVSVGVFNQSGGTFTQGNGTTSATWSNVGGGGGTGTYHPSGHAVCNNSK